MPDIQPTAETEAPVRYVLHRLPHPDLEERQRERQRSAKRLNTALFGGMLFMVVWGVGMVVFEIAYGTASTVGLASLVLVYAALTGWTVFHGNVGVRGRYHQIHADNCTIALEDEQLAAVGSGYQHGNLGNIPAELVPEYLRLLHLTRDAYKHAHGLRRRLDEIKFHGMDPELIVDDGRLPGWPVKDDHVD